MYKTITIIIAQFKKNNKRTRYMEEITLNYKVYITNTKYIKIKESVVYG